MSKCFIDKVYDKNGNEIPRDFQLESFPELTKFLTRIWCRIKQQKAQQENKIEECA